MSAMHPAQHRPNGDDVGTIMRSVSEDLVAIFGPGIRALEHMPGVRRSARVRSGRRRQALAAIAAGVLATAVVAGMFAGRSATEAFTTARAPRVGDQTSRPMKSPSSATAISKFPAQTPIASLVAVPIPVAQTALISATSRAANMSSAVLSPPAPSSVTTVVSKPSRSVSRETAIGVPVIAQQSSYDDEADGGFASRVDLAEQRLADAYDRALAVGVRPNILRGYRREWDRARREAAEQPQASLRLYAMITSDFYNLVDDAEASDGRSWRR